MDEYRDIIRQEAEEHDRLTLMPDIVDEVPPLVAPPPLPGIPGRVIDPEALANCMVGISDWLYVFDQLTNQWVSISE
jgi:hypothetical protein